MAEERKLSVENRLDRLEELFSSAGDLILDNRGRATQVEDRLDRVEELLISAGEFLQSASVRIDRVSERLDSLTASGERHDRILDYLLKRDADNTGD